MSNVRKSSVIPRMKVCVPKYPRLLNAGFAVVLAACGGEVAGNDGDSDPTFGGVPMMPYEPDGGNSDPALDGDTDVTYEWMVDSDPPMGGAPPGTWEPDAGADENDNESGSD